MDKSSDNIQNIVRKSMRMETYKKITKVCKSIMCVYTHTNTETHMHTIYVCVHMYIIVCVFRSICGKFKK